MAEVKIEHITKVYPGNKKNSISPKAIDDVSFTVLDKEFMVIVGPSGCGKSTLLRMIAGLEEIETGTISIDGKTMNGLDPRDRDIAMVFQNYALYPHMTVYDNMAFGLKLKHFSRQEIKERVTKTAQMLEMEEVLDRKPKTLSGGQRQRVAIGRAIVRRPKVFLFDEPLSNLDAKLRSQMRIELQKLHREINATMIYVTHDQTEAMTLGNRIAVLNKGKLMQLDTPLHLYNHPGNRFVAGFIGSPTMNFIKGSVQEEKGYYFEDESRQCRISLGAVLPNALQGYAGRPVQIGVRPEHMLLCINPADPIGVDCSLQVTAFENMGNEQLVYFSLNGNTIIVRGEAREAIEPGRSVGIRFLKGKIIYMDINSGEVVA